MPRKKTKELNNHLILHGWLNDQFGYKTTRDLLSDVSNVDEGFNPNGYSPICEFLMSRSDLKNEIEEALPIYDANIKRHLSAINNNRTQPIVLRYFQYLALLYTEIFLDWKFNKPAEFLHQLNTFVQTQNARKAPGDPRDTDFTEIDIEKLALWMATGAGKTHIMHINYHQYLHYYKDKLDHVVLITPNEGLSEQHMRELTNADIRCERFKVEGSRSSNNNNIIQVIEITKLVKEKTGEGESVPVEAFEGNNLILVDEGHKGTSSTDPVWRDHRETLAEKGFTFEYSATFGQALAAAKNDDLVDEYGKAIVFDYSYRHFYSDGYGKDFRIINVTHDNETQTEKLFLGNLLSFYQQKRYFKENTDNVRAYSLDPPLWAFVGSKVNVVYQNYTRSDVLNVIRFLHGFLRNEKRRAIQGIDDILNGASGLSDVNGNDVFKNRLDYLKNTTETASQIYTDILKEVFHTDSSGALHLCDVRNAQGEIALKTTHGSKEFGVINIGDVPKFKKLVQNQNDDAGIKMDPDDVLIESLFNNINKPESSINILIGAKKFIEGWDSWRVTTMGLLNIGRQEGSQIIQLFGRGVRLRGKNMSLKRSAVLDGDHPPNLPLLETLNIFAVRANFMEDFQEYLKREGVPHEDPIQIELPIKPNMSHLAKRLYVPKVLSYDQVAKGKCVMLEACDDIIVTHTTQTVSIIGSSSEEGIQDESAEAANETLIKEQYLDLVDWEKIYLQLVEYKQERGYHNLVFDADILRNILNTDNPLYELKVMHKSEVEPKSLEQLKQLEELVLTLLRKYITKFYRIIQQRWNDEGVRLKQLDEKNPNFADWKVSIPRDKSDELEPIIRHLIEDGRIYGPDLTDLPNLHNDRHLYQPLLTIGGADSTLRITPPALEKSEEDFVKHLRSYVRQPREDLAKKEIFFLRNQSRGRGIGFYDNEGFYPDFILWILDGAKQRIVFIEPHGMIHEPINKHNPKITLFKRLRDFSYKRFRSEHVQMDSYIISTTPITKLRYRGGKGKQELQENWHILFPNHDDVSYLSPIFQDLDSNPPSQ
ncbi:MAG: DEAD/DEAH box helicase family protein [Candidatus Poribacteria bacterium]|nr:DEAD/DEAH box helicase family protein [Candidatus Poribacteria bacterium]